MFKKLAKLNEKYIISVLKKVPGEQRFGLYRFLPLFFLFGASLEFLMINWKAGPNQVNFCEFLSQPGMHVLVMYFGLWVKRFVTLTCRLIA